jgi:hypothetical protein
MSATKSGVLLVLTARIPRAGVAQFQAYEAQVLPLLGAHGGRLERRLRTEDGTVEVHLVRFIAQDGLDSFRRDPVRAAAAHLLASSGAAIELNEVNDVD